MEKEDTIILLRRIRYRLINQDRQAAKCGLMTNYTNEILALETAINELEKK